MVAWHHQLNGHEFAPALRDGDGQESLACCGPWGLKESEQTERLKSNSNNPSSYVGFVNISPFL